MYAGTLGFVADLVIRNSSSVAWIACLEGSGAEDADPRCRPKGAFPPPSFIVYKHDATTTGYDSTRLDEDTDIAVSSLRLMGSTLSWRNGDERRTHQLR